jgi:hypothetical protein
MLVKGRKNRRWVTQYPNAAEKLAELGTFPQPAERLHRVPTSEDLGHAPFDESPRDEGRGRGSRRAR